MIHNLFSLTKREEYIGSEIKYIGNNNNTRLKRNNLHDKVGYIKGFKDRNEGWEPMIICDFDGNIFNLYDSEIEVLKDKSKKENNDTSSDNNLSPYDKFRTTVKNSLYDLTKEEKINSLNEIKKMYKNENDLFKRTAFSIVIGELYMSLQ